jgi:hypothetical protein
MPALPESRGEGMIKIINKKPEMPDKESTYHVYINDEFICEFKHKRIDGLGKCLMEAGKAVEKARLFEAWEVIKGFEK